MTKTLLPVTVSSDTQTKPFGYKTHLDAQLNPFKGIPNHEPSRTVPGQAFNVKELIERSYRGLPISGEKVPVYNGEVPIPDFDRMDLAEIEAFRNEVTNRIAETRYKLAQQQQQEYQKKQQPQNAPPSGAQYPKKTQGQGTESLPPEASHTNQTNSNETKPNA